MWHRKWQDDPCIILTLNKAPKKFVSCYPTYPVLTPDPNLFIDSMREEKRKTYFWFMWINFKPNWQLQVMFKLILHGECVYVKIWCITYVFRLCSIAMHYNSKKKMKKKTSWPTNPIIFSFVHVTGNKYISLFGPNFPTFSDKYIFL